jgi:hypothetical protein
MRPAGVKTCLYSEIEGNLLGPSGIRREKLTPRISTTYSTDRSVKLYSSKANAAGLDLTWNDLYDYINLILFFHFY